MSWRDRLLMKLMSNRLVIKIMSVPIIVKILTKVIQAFTRVTSPFKRKK
jgi:hypothetical protein